MDFREILDLLLRKKWYILSIPVVTGLMAFSVRFFLFPRIYASESQISTGLTTSSLYSDEGPKMSPFEVMLNFENLMENMESKMVLNRLSYTLIKSDLSSNLPFRTPEIASVELDSTLVREINHVLDSAISNYILIGKSSDLGLKINNLIEEFGYTEEELKDNSSIKRVGNSDFINIRYESENPLLSAFVVNEWARNFIEYYQFTKGEILTASLEELNRILNEKQRLLDENTTKLNRFKGRYSSALNNANSDVDPAFEYEKLIREKSSEVNSIKVRLANVRDQMSYFNNMNSSDEGRKKIVEIRKSIDFFQSELESYPGDRILADSLDLLKRQLVVEMTKYTNSNIEREKLNELFQQENNLEVEFEIAQTDLGDLQREYENQRGTAVNSAFVNSQLKNLETVVEQSRDDYILAQDKYNKARSRQIVKDSKLKVSYFGDIPELPQSRKTIIFSIMGLMVGGVGTVFMVGFFYFIDPRVLNQYKFKRMFGVVPASTIPYISNLNSFWENYLSISELKESNEASFDALKRSINILRHEIQISNSKVFLFSSLKKSSGKSVALSLIASSLSLVNKKVLIIDTNFRNPDVTSQTKKASSVRGEVGFQYALMQKNNTKISAIVDSPNFIQNKDGSLVYVLGASQTDRSPEEIFSLLDFGKFIEVLKDKFDYIFLESSSIDSNSDSIELMEYSDFSVFVFSLSDEIGSEDMASFERVKERTGSYFTILNCI